MAQDESFLIWQVRDCEGNHLSFPTPPIELLEHMLQHPERRPIQQLLPSCRACLHSVHDELRSLSGRLLQRPALARFPQLQHRIREEMEVFLERLGATTHAKLEEMVKMEVTSLVSHHIGELHLH